GHLHLQHLREIIAPSTEAAHSLSIPNELIIARYIPIDSLPPIPPSPPAPAHGAKVLKYVSLVIPRKLYRWRPSRDRTDMVHRLIIGEGFIHEAQEHPRNYYVVFQDDDSVVTLKDLGHSAYYGIGQTQIFGPLPNLD